MLENFLGIQQKRSTIAPISLKSFELPRPRDTAADRIWSSVYQNLDKTSIVGKYNHIIYY